MQGSVDVGGTTVRVPLACVVLYVGVMEGIQPQLVDGHCLVVVTFRDGIVQGFSTLRLSRAVFLRGLVLLSVPAAVVKGALGESLNDWNNVVGGSRLDCAG